MLKSCYNWFLSDTYEENDGAEFGYFGLRVLTKLELSFSQ